MVCIVFEQAVIDPILLFIKASHVEFWAPHMIRIDIVANNNCSEMFSTILLLKNQKKFSRDVYISLINIEPQVKFLTFLHAYLILFSVYDAPLVAISVGFEFGFV